MDLLCRAYSTASDDDDEPERGRPVLPPPSKRPKPEYSRSHTEPSAIWRRNSTLYTPTEAPIQGRYISKRERAVLASVPVVADPTPPDPVTSTPGSSLILDFFILQFVNVFYSGEFVGNHPFAC
ncbi:hypothetical protein U1Q18_024138 [Sarracenia purpurea var. burkii]